MKSKRLFAFGVLLILAGIVAAGAAPFVLAGPSISTNYPINSVWYGDLPLLSEVIEKYKEQKGDYPSSLFELTTPKIREPYIRIVPKDPWGSEYAYRIRRNEYELYSIGANGIDEKTLGDDVVAGNEKKYECDVYGIHCGIRTWQIAVYFFLSIAFIGLMMACAGAVTYTKTRFAKP